VSDLKCVDKDSRSIIVDYVGGNVCHLQGEEQMTTTMEYGGNDPARCTGLVAMPDGHVLVADRKSVTLWKATSGGISWIRDVLQARGNQVVSCFAPMANGGLVVGLEDGWVCVFDANVFEKQNQELKCTLTWDACIQSEGGVRCVVAMTDGRVVSNVWGSGLMVWPSRKVITEKYMMGNDHVSRTVPSLHNGHVNSHRVIFGGARFPSHDGVCLHGHVAVVTCVLVLHDGRLASGSEDRTVRVWDANTGDCIIVLAEHTDVVTGLSELVCSRLVSASLDGSLRVWNLNSTVRMVSARIIEGVVNRVNRRGRMSTVRSSITLRCNGLCASVPIHGVHGVSVHGVSALADGRLASGSFRSLRVWDVDTGVCTIILQPNRGPNVSLSPMTHPRGFRMFIAGLGDGRVVSYDYDLSMIVWK